MSTDIHSPYAQTASYFVFKTIITIVSSFVSVSILTIHWIEYNNNKFNDLPVTSAPDPAAVNINSENSKSRKKLRKYTLPQRITLRLSWLTIIIFCTICICFALLTVVHQVARLNEIHNILCTKWTVRILSSTVQFGVGLMHCLFMSRLSEIFSATEFAYSSTTLRLLCLIIVNLSVLSSILVLLFLDVDEYEIIWLHQTHSTCTTVVPQFVNIIVGGTELFVVLLMMYLFLHPVNKMIYLHKSDQVDYPHRLIFRIHKITTLALIASISTFISASVIGWTYAIWPAFIDMPLNCICILFMTNYYPNGYRHICCLFTRLRVRLFRKAHRNKLRSAQVYHASQQSSIVVDLKGIDDNTKQQETEAYLGVHDRPSFRDHESYDPYGGGKIERLQQQSPSHTMILDENITHKKDTGDTGNYALLAAHSNSNPVIQSNDSKHKMANTTEIMIMDMSALAVAKSKSIEMNDTMINRSTSEPNKKGQLLNDNNNNIIQKHKQKMKKDSSFQLSDNDINNLMDTIDDHHEYATQYNEQIEYQTSVSTKL